MRVLPAWLQPALTWLTGKPLRDQPAWNLTPLHHLGSGVLALLGGVLLGVVALLASSAWLLLLLPAWVLTIHGAVKLRTMIVHQCSHTNFTGDKRLDDQLGEWLSILLLTQSYESYKPEHIADHHSKNHMTPADPTVQFILVHVDAHPGMASDEMWRRMYRTMVSPRYHLLATWSRLASHLHTNSHLHQLKTLALYAAVLALVALTHSWLLFLLAWVFPLTILLNMSSCVRLCGKHVFPVAGTHLHDRNTLASFTHGIFLGELVPDPALPPGRKQWAWARWWARMLFVHLLCRLLVLVGDTPCHDFHHRFPRAKAWPNYIFARQQDLMAGHPGWPPYTEIWGLFPAIQATFVSLSQADPDAYDMSRSRKVSAKELYAALEE
jgi:hypothetical protein